MEIKTLKILSINPGSSYLGLAVFYGYELKDWGIKTLRYSSFQERIRCTQETILKYIHQRAITVLAVKKLHPSRSSQNLNRLVLKINEYAQDYSLPAYEYSLDEIKEFLLPEGHTNKLALMEEVVQRYSDLSLELQSEKNTKNHYSRRMFEAVAIGIVCSHHLTSKYSTVEK
jgi:Holliday junction resolvasome RuvABC endonuclease subunit